MWKNIFQIGKLYMDKWDVTTNQINCSPKKKENGRKKIAKYRFFVLVIYGMDILANLWKMDHFKKSD